MHFSECKFIIFFIVLSTFPIDHRAEYTELSDVFGFLSKEEEHVFRSANIFCQDSCVKD